MPSDGGGVTAARSALPPGEAEMVFGALFPKRLRSREECPAPRDSQTWSEVDRIQRSDLDAGRFVPVVEQRAGEGEVRYVIRMETCQQNDVTPRIEAVFPPGAVEKPNARPASVREVWAKKPSR